MDDPWEPMLVAPPEAASSHLADGELFADHTSAMDKHLSECAWCRRRLDSARIAESDDDEDFEQALRAAKWREDFAQVSRETILPDQVRAAMTAPASVGDVEPGQLWRLTWRDRHILAAVLDVADWQVLCAPVTTDTKLADELTLLIPAESSPLVTDLAIWVRNKVAVPLFVFDRPLGTLPPVGSAHMGGQAALQQLARAHLTGSAVPEGLPVGMPLSENDTDRLAMHDALWEQTDWFAAASAGLIDSDGVPLAVLGSPETDQGAARPLPNLLRDSGLPLSKLAEQTGLTMARLLDLTRGQATATQQEIAAIQKATGGTVAINDRDRLVNAVTALTEVSRPTWRGARQCWTKDHSPDADPEDPTPLVTRALQQSLAARSIRQDCEAEDEQQRLRNDWRDRIAMILHEYK